MEVDILLRFDCDGPEQREKIIEFLQEHSRPVLDEDVAPEYREMFSILEFVEFPNSIDKVGEQSVHAYFTSGWPDIVKALVSVGVQQLVACVRADEHVQVVREIQGKLVRVLDQDPDALVMIDGEDGKVSLEQAGGDDVFRYLDKLSESRERGL